MLKVSLFQDKVACPLFYKSLKGLTPLGLLGAGMAFFVDFQELS